MADKRFHLGWFMNFTTNEWNTPFGNDGLPWNGKFYIEMAQAMEKACFDYIMIEDPPTCAMTSSTSMSTSCASSGTPGSRTR